MFLERHAWRLGSRIDHLADVLRTYESVERSRADTFDVERTIVQLQIEWEHFVRAVILDSATGRYRSKSGPVSSKLPIRINGRDHAGHVLIGQYQKRKHEPDWYLPQDAIAAAGKLALTNEAKIATELGISPWEIDDLRHLRNFIAHRSTRSATSVRDTMAIRSSDRIEPADICFDFRPGGKRRYETWVEFMKLVGNKLVE